MTWFADLTPYSYGPSREDPKPLNVGWLSIKQPFPTGATSVEFQRRLGELCARPADIGFVCMGPHSCEWCVPALRAKGVTVFADGEMATGEIRVRGPRGMYAAPTMIIHYVTAHGYLPPPEFIEAVLG